MIYDRLVNAGKYLGISENLDLALHYIIGSLDAMPQEIELKGKDVRAFHCTYDTVPESEGFFEAHEHFADIQIMRSGCERVAVSNTARLSVEEAQPENDFWRMAGPEEVSVVLRPDSFLVVFPGDAHKLKLMIGNPETVTKAVFKVRMK